MKALLIVLFAAFLLAGAQTHQKTVILLREDGNVFGVITLRFTESDTIYATVSDSSLVGSRLAHDDAIANARGTSETKYFDQKFMTAQQKKLIETK